MRDWMEGGAKSIQDLLEATLVVMKELEDERAARLRLQDTVTLLRNHLRILETNQRSVNLSHQMTLTELCMRADTEFELRTVDRSEREAALEHLRALYKVDECRGCALCALMQASPLPARQQVTPVTGLASAAADLLLEPDTPGPCTCQECADADTGRMRAALQRLSDQAAEEARRQAAAAATSGAGGSAQVPAQDETTEDPEINRLLCDETPFSPPPTVRGILIGRPPTPIPPLEDVNPGWFAAPVKVPRKRKALSFDTVVVEITTRSKTQGRMTRSKKAQQEAQRKGWNPKGLNKYPGGF